METLEIRAPDDWHLHLREGPMLRRVLPHTAALFGRALIMPNLVPPIRNGADVKRYRDQIMEACDDSGLLFEPLMTFKITPETTIADVKTAKAAGAIAGKLYPDGVTTNSEGGVRDVRALYSIFEQMAHLDLVLCLHGEHPDAEVMDREERFITDVLHDLLNNFPHLRIVLEHITTERAVNEVRFGPDNLAATITAHHLEISHSDVLGWRGGKLQPHLFCMPIAKWEKDKHALIGAATSGSPKFFFGSDSAPHPVSAKECADGCAGVYSAPVLLPVLAEVFEKAGELHKLEAFTSKFGADFYGLPLNEGTVQLRCETWTVEYQEGDLLRPYRAGETLLWQT